MRLFKVFHAVKTGSAEEKVAFWRLCKTAAASEGLPVPIGLTKIALDIWADGYESGMGATVDRSTREAFAGSFGSAAVAEQEFGKWAAEGRISEDEHDKLASWLAEGAVNDLVQLTKSAGTMDVLRNPRVIGAITGTAIGAGLGAWKDDDNRARGAIMGAIPGALVGAALGHGVVQYQSAQAEALTKNQAAQAEALLAQAFQNEALRGRAQTAVDAYVQVAETLNDPSLKRYILSHAKAIGDHHAAGHNHLPELMNKVITDPGKRIEFAARVAKMVPRTKKASMQSKLADIMQGLDQGGQPPMNADVPQGLPEGSEAIADPDQGQTEAMEGVDRAHKVVDNMIFLAQQVQLPQLAQEMEQNREGLANHFAEGNAYLPPELQHNFAQSEHAEAFMKKYKQRFGSPNVGGKKTAGFMENMKQHVDSFRGLAPGGVDMEELRKYLPDAQYAGMVETQSGKRQPGFVSQQIGMTRTWDPAVVRHMRSADPKGFYRSLAEGVSPERPRSILTDAPETQKTASTQDAWLSWRTHR